MTRDEQRQFIRNMCAAVADHLISKVDAMPEDWNGHELRELIADEFDHERTIGSRLGVYKDARRVRAYRRARAAL